MSLSSRLQWGWQPVDSPISPLAAVAWSGVARRLHDRLIALPTDQQARLQITANCDVLIVMGSTSDLPWVEGIEYAAPSADAPALWLPTRWQPDVSIELLAKAFLGKNRRQPLLLWQNPAVVIPLDKSQPLSFAQLDQIATRWQGD